MISSETRKRLSESHKGQIPWNKGLSVSLKQKEKQSKTMKELYSRPEYKEKLSLSHIGRKHSDETKRRMSEAHKGHFTSDETKRKISESQKCKFVPIEQRIKSSQSHKGNKHTNETKRKISENNARYWEGKNHKYETKTKISKTKKEQGLKESPEHKTERMKRIGQSLKLKPNKPESFILNLLNELYPGEWKYTGDFSFMINGKNPDFTNCNGQKKLIEIFGDYWHRNENPEDRKKIFKEFGYETLVLWETELRDLDFVKFQIQEFMID